MNDDKLLNILLLCIKHNNSLVFKDYLNNLDNMYKYKIRYVYKKIIKEIIKYNNNEILVILINYLINKYNYQLSDYIIFDDQLYYIYYKILQNNINYNFDIEYNKNFILYILKIGNIKVINSLFNELLRLENIQTLELQNYINELSIEVIDYLKINNYYDFNKEGKINTIIQILINNNMVEKLEYILKNYKYNNNEIYIIDYNNSIDFVELLLNYKLKLNYICINILEKNKELFNHIHDNHLCNCVIKRKLKYLDKHINFFEF